MTRLDPDLETPDYRFTRIETRKKKSVDEHYWRFAFRHDDEDFRLALRSGMNYGVVMGWGRLFVIDVEDADLLRLVEERLPDTKGVLTPGKEGCQFYFKHTNEENIEVVRNFLLVDHDGQKLGHIFARNCQVVGPNSIHPNNRTYRVIHHHPIAEIDFRDVITALNDHLREVPDELDAVDVRPDDLYSQNGMHILDLLPSAVGFIRIGDELIGPHPHHDVNGDGRHLAINPGNDTWHCTQCGTTGNFWGFYAMLRGVVLCEDVDMSLLRQDEVFQRVLEFVYADNLGFELRIERTMCCGCGASLQQNGRPYYTTCSDCGRHVCEKCFPWYMSPFRCWPCWSAFIMREYATMNSKGKYEVDKWGMVELIGIRSNIKRPDDDQKEVYFFDYYNTVWRKLEAKSDEKQASLKRFVYETLGNETKTTDKNWIVDAALARATMARDEMKELPLEILPLQNGFYHWPTDRLIDIETEDFRPEDFLFDAKHPITWDPEATCEVFLQFLETALDAQDLRDTIIEWIGYCFLRSYKIRKMLILHGPSATGKTTLLEAMREIIGEEFCSSVGITEMEKDRFAGDDFRGKTANINSEASDMDVHDCSVLKALCGGDSKRVQGKYAKAYNLKNRAKLSFCCNKIPTFHEASDAIWRRLLIIPFMHQVEEEDEIHDLQEKMVGERDGIFNLAMEGLRRLMANGKFSMQKSWRELRQEYMVYGTPITMFCTERTELDPRASEDKYDLYENYRLWCDYIGIESEGQVKFYRELYALYPQVKPSKEQDKDTKRWVKTIEGIKLIPDEYGSLSRKRS